MEKIPILIKFQDWVTHIYMKAEKKHILNNNECFLPTLQRSSSLAGRRSRRRRCAAASTTARTPSTRPAPMSAASSGCVWTGARGSGCCGKRTSSGVWLWVGPRRIWFRLGTLLVSRWSQVTRSRLGQGNQFQSSHLMCMGNHCQSIMIRL